MATLVLQAAGQAVGKFLGPIGAAVGKAAGSIAGAVIDNRLFGSDGKTAIVGKIDDLSVQTSSSGAPIPRVYGRMRLAGTVIWATNFEEVVREETAGGKGGGTGEQTIEEYSYYANFAVGIAEGPITRVGRIWADGKVLDLTTIAHRIYLGAEDQEPDPLILAKQGEAPAYRGLAYIVFERMPVTPYGNRLPQLTFEIVRAVDDLERDVRAVTLIPGASEFGYQPAHVKRTVGPGETSTDNRHLGVGRSDFEASVEELLALCPNLERVALVVAWFGSDLRAGACRIEPAIEFRKRTTSLDWGVAGRTRETARVVSTIEGVPAYGGTPDDASVIAAIRFLKERGLKVTFYPFILMDVPAGNDLPDPHGGSSQPPYPWRGRITVDPARGVPGSVDGTAEAEAQIASLVGTATAGDVIFGADSATYAGPDEWTLSRMALHYASLCVSAGGVDAFLIASELPGLTTARGPGNTFPFVDGLRRIAADVKSVLGPGTLVSYAADWSEFFGFQPPDGSGDVFFHLDPLWSDPAVDFVGIDVYWPLSDWRDGDHLDAGIADNIYDVGYLRGNITGGEGFDWYYPDAEARAAQARAAIADGLYGEPWTFRYKDLLGWWSNPHHDRPGGAIVGMVPDGDKPALWGLVGGGATVTAEPGTFLGVFKNAVRITDTSGNYLSAVTSASVAMTAGETYLVRLFYKAGTTVHHRLTIDIRNASGVFWAYVYGTDGALSVIADGTHVFGAIENISHGEGVYEARFEFVPSQTDSQSNWSFGPGGNTTGLDNVLIALTVTQAGRSTTGWVPRSKPIWITEVGCPAIDRGSNQPNVFYDPKSSESRFPHFSNGGRDDAVQRRYLEAMIAHFATDNVGLDDRNPVSPLYGERMVAPDAIHLWTWDARPWPAFPYRVDVWADGENWQRGHWLTGRFGGMSAAALARALFADYGLDPPEILGLHQMIDGFVRTEPTSLRAELEVLSEACPFVGVDVGDRVLLASLERRPVATIREEDLVDGGEREPLVSRRRLEEDDLPGEQRLVFIDSGRDFTTETASVQRPDGYTARIETALVPLALPDGMARQLAEVRLFDAWAGRSRLSFSLPRRFLRLTAGDILSLPSEPGADTFLIEEIEDGGRLAVAARSIDRAIFRPSPAVGTGWSGEGPAVYGPPVIHILDLPPLSETGEDHAPWIAAYAHPWPSAMAVWSTASGTAFDLATVLARPAIVGVVEEPAAATRFSRWDMAHGLTVRLHARQLDSRHDLDVFAGRNAIAVMTRSGDWEVVQFQTATLVAHRTYRLSRLLRGQLGTEDAARSGIDPGAPIVVLDEALQRLPLRLDRLDLPLTYRVGAAELGHAADSALEVVHAASGRGLMPYAPVHARVRRDPADGSLVLDWIRRSRHGGDSWSAEEIPLGETAELYRVEILVAGLVRRTVEVPQPSFVYPLADQLLDLAGTSPPATARIAQVAPGFGPGVTTELVLDVD